MRILAVNLTLTLLLLVAIEGGVRLAHPEITPAGTDRKLLADRPRVYYEHDRRLYDGPPLAATAAELRRLQTLAEERSIRLDVVLLPYEYQLRHTDDDAFVPQQRLKDAFGDDLNVHDAAPFLHAHTHEAADLYLYGDGIHFSRAGHELVARYVQKYVMP